MKKLILSFFLLASLIAPAQTYPICVVFDKNHKPLKAYQELMDGFGWMNKHNECSYQENVNLHYRDTNDSTVWRPSNMVIMNCVYNPVTLTDNWLKADTIYLVMMNGKATAHIADRAYQYMTDGQHYVDNFKLAFVKIPYYKRDKRSYDEIYRRKRMQLGLKQRK